MYLSGYVHILCQREIWLMSGAYQPEVGSLGFSNDIHVFNVDQRKWKNLQVNGRPPQQLWSSTAGLVGNTIYFVHGCQVVTFTDDVYAFKVS